MKLSSLFIAILFYSNSFTQDLRKISGYFMLEGNKTIYDRTKSNNSGGFGIGFLSFLNTASKVRPMLELNVDLFGGTKELLTIDGKPVESKSGVTSLYIGPCYQPSEKIFLSAALGTSIYNGALHGGIRPSIAVFPGEKKKFAVKASFTNIFQKDEISSQSFGYLTFALVFKLF